LLQKLSLNGCTNIITQYETLFQLLYLSLTALESTL